MAIRRLVVRYDDATLHAHQLVSTDGANDWVFTRLLEHERPLLSRFQDGGFKYAWFCADTVGSLFARCCGLRRLH